MNRDAHVAAYTVRCPECGRGVGTWLRDGELLMLGHRVKADHTPVTPWCPGGGRHVAERMRDEEAYDLQDKARLHGC